LKGLEEIDENLNLTILNNNKVLFALTYIRMDDSENVKVPGLDGWEITEFNSLGMSVALKFTNPIYVSSGKVRDKVIFEIKEPQIFQRSFRRLLTAQEKPETIKLTIDMKP